MYTYLINYAYLITPLRVLYPNDQRARSINRILQCNWGEAIHVFGANFHLVQNRLKVDVTPISINSVKTLVG